MPAGSTWNIWDLQVHTPHSALNNQFGDPSSHETWDTYVTRLEDASKSYGVVAIGVTDYFTIEGYTRLVDFQTEGRLDGILLIPNVEFRIDKVVYRDKDATNPKRLNLHVLLSPSIPANEIQEHFLDDLDFVHEQEPFQPANTRKLKRSNLVAFGSTLQEQHDAFKGKHPFEIGCLNAVVSADAIKERLDSRFRGNYLLVLAEETLPLLDWDSQHHATRKQLMQMAHAVFSSNARTRAFCLGLEHPSSDKFIEEFKSLKPCIWGSDCHALDDRFLCPDQGRFCWIKGEVSWEGLKQVLFEPAERLAIQTASPEPPKSIYSIKRLDIPQSTIRPSVRLAQAELEFNPNLVAIIGGRGSGKTALLDLVASFFAEGRKLPSIQASFIHRLFFETPPAGEPASSHPTLTVTLASDATLTKQVGGDETAFDASDVVYLTQNHFDEYSAYPDKLDRHIIALVFEHFVEEERQRRALADDLVANDHRIQELSLRIEQLTEEVSSRKEVEIPKLASLEGTKADLEIRIKDIETTQGGQASEAKNLSARLDNLLVTDLAISSAATALDQVRNALREFLRQYEPMAPAANNTLARAQEALGPGLLTLLPTQLPDTSEVLERIDRNRVALDSEEAKTKAALTDTRSRIAELEGLDKLLADLRGELSTCAVQLDDVRARIAKTTQDEETLTSLAQARIEAFAEGMQLTVSLRQFLQSVIDRFRSTSSDALENIAFDASIDFSALPIYLQSLASKLDNRVHSEAAVAESLAPIVDMIRARLSGVATNEDYLSDAARLYSALSPLKTKRAVSLAEYAGAVFRRFFRVGLTVEYSGKRMADLSMGERAIILLKVLLALGDSPLLIDQPEEHLDNRFVFDDLTPAFREAKKRRQILIATHNANLVVNTDAEQVIVADNTVGELSYTLGTLEDLGIRDTITSILEGGDEAFRRRERRYGYIF